jgi:23S rRNA pseudouridine1911/1915/1917 synthase
MNSQILRFTLTEGGQRLDRFLAAQLTTHSRSELQHWIHEGCVQVNGREAKPSYKLAAGDAITITLLPPTAVTLVAQDIAIPILYDDDDLIIVDKPAGLVVHPGNGVASGTLVNALLARYPELKAFEDSLRPGIVHRLDKDTSGVMVVAKHPAAQHHLQAQFAAHTIKKTYWALAQGTLQNERGLIEASIGRNRTHPTQMAIAGRAERAARTAFKVLEPFTHCTLLEAYPITGRTHQIRLHFAALGHPLIGDATYNPRGETWGLTRQFLHAKRLRLVLPTSGQAREFVSELPTDLQRVLSSVRRASRAAIPSRDL